MDGERLGPYAIDRELGSGGMGKVYAATVADRVPGLATGAKVALKVVHPHLLESPGFFRRFLQEAQVGARIQHENVVRTHMADALGTHHFLVMEYVEGQDLRALLHEFDRVPEELCRHIGREIAKGLTAIHDAGVVHRDLKPENVLITAEHVVKVMDLGVARLADEQMRLSHSGAFVGSAEYAAPEQFGGEVDHRCDLHALGLLLYELSCGQHPYRADDFRHVMKRVCEATPRRAGEINPQLSAFFEELVHTLLAKSPDDRFASAAELFTVLDEGEDSVWWHERALALRATTNRPLRRIRIPRETAVYGREGEIEKLRTLFERAKSGDGRVVLVQGEAGIGKSRLVDELIARLQAAGEDVNFLFGSYPPGGAATASGAFSTAYREHFGEVGCDDYLPQTAVLAAAFNALLRGASAPTGAELLTKDSLQTCFVNVTHSLAAERVTVVLIDDLHFAPAEGRALFTALATAVPGCRVLLIGTTRAGVDQEWQAGLSRLDHTTQIELSRLGPKDLAKLLEDSFKSEELAHRLGVQVGLKSDGNPFFAFEIIRGLREGQFIKQREDGTWVSTRIIDEIQIPSSVLDLVNARVADLTQEDRDLLDVAACWGFEFDPALIADVVGEPLLPTLKRFAAIEKRHRLIRAAGRRLVFDHHQVQEMLYSTLYEQMREAYHATLADALESRTKAATKDVEALDGVLCVDLCEHFFKGAQGERAMRYLDLAIAHLVAGHQNEQAVALADRALAGDGLVSGEARVDLLIEKSRRLDTLGRPEQERVALDEALSIAETLDADGPLARANGWLGWLLYRVGEFAAARRVLDLAIEQARSSGDREIEALSTGNVGNVLFRLGRTADAIPFHEGQLRISREIGFGLGESNALGNIANCLASIGRFDEAERHFEQQISLARAIGHRDGEVNGIGNLGGFRAGQGRVREALDAQRQQLSLARELGGRRHEAYALANLGVLLLGLGARDEGRRHLRSARDLCEESGVRTLLAVVLLETARADEEAGDTATAERLIRQALEHSQALGFSGAVRLAQLALGRLLSSARPAEAAECLDGLAAAGAPEDGGEPDGLSVLAACARAVLPGGDPARAADMLARGEARMAHGERMDARFLLWRATSDRAHLEEAHRLLMSLRDNAPDEYRVTMMENVACHREILAAWRGDAIGGALPEPPDEPRSRGTESITRAG